jgi:hypothetical protein
VARRIGQLLIDRIAVALDNAGVARKQSDRVLAAEAGGLGIGYARRIGATPGSIIERRTP